jgi:hypothetical protein
MVRLAGVEPATLGLEVLGAHTPRRTYFQVSGPLVPLSRVRESAVNCAQLSLIGDALGDTELGRPSVLAVNAEKRGGAIIRVRVGGQCAPVMAGNLVV